MGSRPPRRGLDANHGLRILGGGMRLEIPWARPGELPVVRPGPAAAGLRRGPGPRRAEAGAQLREQTTAIDAIRDERTGRVTGVVTKDGQAVRAPITLVCRRQQLAVLHCLGRQRREDRPMGVAYRR